jgi:hypothetical protein
MGLRFVAFASLVFACMAAPASAQPWFTDATDTHLPARASVTHNSMDVDSVDLDGDGDLDLVIPQEWRPNKVLINDGRGHFTFAPNYLPASPAAELITPEGANPLLANKDSEDVSIADFNRDGRLDIIMVVEDDLKFGRANVHQYYRARAEGGYERIYGQLPDTIANAVAHADLNGDGAPDLYIAGDGQDRLLINDGAGTFRDETEARIPREAAVAQDVEFFDADGDSDLDIVLGLEGGHALWINNGQAVFSDESRARLPVPGNVEARKVTPVDVDADGDLDLYFAHVAWQGRVPQDRLYINDGAGRFSDGTAERLPVEDHLSLDAKFADLDRDGDLDLVQGNAGSLRIYANDGRGRFTDITAEALGGVEVLGASIAVEVADFNGDRRPDIYVGQLANQNEPNSQDRLFLNARRR